MVENALGGLGKVDHLGHIIYVWNNHEVMLHNCPKKTRNPGSRTFQGIRRNLKVIEQLLFYCLQSPGLKSFVLLLDIKI